MLEEAKAMIRVSKHDHIVNIQGVCEHNDSVYLLLEFCSLGPIDDFLRKQHSTLNNQTSIKDLIHWSSQVADGMGFLADKNIIHVSSLINFYQDLYQSPTDQQISMEKSYKRSNCILRMCVLGLFTTTYMKT